MEKRTNPSPAFPMFPGNALEVTPDDFTAFNPSVLYVGVAGDVKVTTARDSVVTFKNVPAGQVVPVQVSKVWVDGTTASGIVRIF